MPRMHTKRDRFMVGTPVRNLQVVTESDRELEVVADDMAHVVLSDFPQWVSTNGINVFKFDQKRGERIIYRRESRAPRGAEVYRF